MFRSLTSKKTFTLLEAIVIAILLGIGITASAKILVAGKTFLKSAENKSEAMRAAAVQMERLLAKSYGSLPEGITQGRDGRTQWQAEVTQKEMGPACSSILGKCIPYKEITVSATYSERQADWNQLHRRVRLINMVPYPKVHIEQEEVISNQNVNYRNPAGANPYAGQDIRNLEVIVNYPVKKNLMVAYNVAVNVEDTDNPIDPDDGLKPTHTIFTKCFVSGMSPYGEDIETRTPIVSQPLISNVVGVMEVGPGEHRITVKWFKDTDEGIVALKRANLIVVATEAK